MRNITGADIAAMVVTVVAGVILVSVVWTYHLREMAYIVAGYTHGVIDGYCAWIKP